MFTTALHRFRQAFRPTAVGLIALCGGMAAIGTDVARAQGLVPPAEIDTQVIGKQIKDGNPDDEAWALALRAISDSDGRKVVLGALKSRPEFPKAALVKRLRHPELGVRMAALEILEGSAGKDFGFDPWIADPADPLNTAAIKSWEEWAAGNGETKIAAVSLDDESMGTYLRDIMAGQRDRAERALRMLEPHGDEATGRIQRFLLDTPNLSEAARAHLRAAQYRIVLRPTAGTEASAVAQRLAFGTRDQQINTLGQLPQFGLSSVPIAMIFLEADDPLIRESALDTVLLMGGEALFPMVRPMLEKESEPNVIHAAIRRFADLKVDGTEQLLVKWLGMEDENIVVECLETIAKRPSGSDHFSGDQEPRGGGGILGAIFGSGAGANQKKPAESPLAKAVVARTSDPVWRIRASAFQVIAKLRIQGYDDAILKGMDDVDPFVQLAAMEAAAALSISAAIPKMEAMFIAQPDRMPVVASGLATMQVPISDKMHEAMANAPAEPVVGVIAALRSKGTTNPDTFARLAKHRDPDVRAAALGALAKEFAEHSTDALRDILVNEISKGDPINARAVLENISLPRSAEPELLAALQARIAKDSDKPSELDPLYDAFLQPLGEGVDKKDESAGVPKAPPGSLEDELLQVAKGGRQGFDEDTRFRAAIVLLESGSVAAAELLKEGLPERPVSQRAAIASSLTALPTKISTPIFNQLLLDPSERVRQAAVAAALYDEDRSELLETILNMLVREGSALEPWDAYGYHLESAISNPDGAKAAEDWCRKVLGDVKSSIQLRVFALSIAPKVGLKPAEIEGQLSQASPLVRRAAVYAWLGTSRKRMERAPAMAEDPSPLVREAVAAGLCPGDCDWIIRFNDLRTAAESTSYEYNRTRTQSMQPSEVELLRGLFTSDPSPSVRFEAAYALVVASKPVDIPAFLRAVSEHPDQEMTRSRLGYFLRSNYQSLGKPFASLLLYADTSHIDPGQMLQMQKHFGLDAARLATFTATGPVHDQGASPQFLDSPAPAPPVADQPVELIFFYSPGCAECEKVSDMLAKLTNGPRKVSVHKHNIKTSDGGLLNQALCLRMGVPSVQQGVSPSVFSPAGALVAAAITPQALDELVGRAATVPVPPDWNVASTEERKAADTALGDKYNNLTLFYVVGGGLLDGINPCAFATIIFFLSYLQVARRSPREILGVGLAFIAAIFITYFLAGLVLYQFLSWVDQLSWARKLLNGFFALFALGIAIFSLRDAWIARQGRLQDMSLQLPAFLKERIRGTIRSGAKQTRYIFAAFSSGVVISLLELACTGQVYAPIIYAVQKGTDNAVAWLLLYNVAFVTPLGIIFGLAFSGMRSNALIGFQQKHTSLVKLLIGLLFLALFCFLAFGTHLLPGGAMK